MQSNLELLKSILSTLNIPYAYNHFNKETECPYILYLEDTSDNTFADNKVYYEKAIYDIELYTDKKNATLESQLKTLLANNDIPYEKIAETYIESEHMYEVVFEIEL